MAHAYERIVGDIRRRIAAGELRPGDRVPSARQLTRDWGVAIATATKALAALRQAGLVHPVAGVGTVVTAARRPAPTKAALPKAAEPDLSRDRIVRAAIAVADGEGLGALSMRRVAADLGVATMSLYRHVHNKDDLVLLMADAVFLDDALPDPPPRGWRAQLEGVARLQWTIYKRHPWLAHVLSVTRPQLLPNGMHHTERALRAIEGLGLHPSAMLHAVVTLANYVRGTAVSLEPEAQAEQDTGLTDQEWIASQEAAFAAVFATGQFPALARLSAHDIDLNLDSLFEFGLRQLLDGLAAHVVRGARSHRA